MTAPTGPWYDAKRYWASLNDEQRAAILDAFRHEAGAFAMVEQYAYALAGGAPAPVVGHIYGTGTSNGRRTEGGRDYRNAR